MTIALTVNTASDPIITVFVSVHTIASEVVAFVRAQVGLNISAVVSEDCACHARPAAE